MSGHTEGPWVRHDTADYAEIHPASGRMKSAIALVGKEGDADLIAAAPDLLAATRALLKLHESHHNEPLHAQARSIIARAEGRQP